MVSENISDASVPFLMPELTGNGTSFDFLCHLHQEIPLFLVFEYGVVSHFGQPS